ncbi:hypothetical protein HMPREF9413_2630 [Paenibacillus sp. HGF7]|nr:hypothetical protein HMPREF9413_2630 [Paenibacillus sp. HGF7]
MSLNIHNVEYLPDVIPRRRNLRRFVSPSSIGIFYWRIAFRLYLYPYGYIDTIAPLRFFVNHSAPG